MAHEFKSLSNPMDGEALTVQLVKNILAEWQQVTVMIEAAAEQGVQIERTEADEIQVRKWMGMLQACLNGPYRSSVLPLVRAAFPAAFPEGSA